MPHLFVNELICHRRYLRVDLHLRPLARVDEAWLALPDQNIPLEVTPKDDHVNLHADAIVSGIQHAPEAIVTVHGELGTLTFKNLMEEQLKADDHNRLYVKMVLDMRDRAHGLDVLEIGSRFREDTKSSFNELRHIAKSYVGVDLLPGNNVDVVADAHRLAAALEGRQFDFVFSAWVFEHLAMPWVAVSEINKVLRVGGEAFIITNQTASLHDLPWDFWRFGQSSWPALFNEQTGFEVVESALGEAARITPLRYHQGHNDHEDGAGFFISSVVVRKISDVAPVWPVQPETVYRKLDRGYPVEIDE